MVELYIDGTAAVLPNDFGTEIKVENSFFTKNGEYTYDIKLRLDNSVNAKLYEHLNRVNSVTEIKEKRRAVLVMDNRTYVDGTEIITDWDNESVSVQIASGNSELNYFIGSDKLISSLDLGKVTYYEDTQNLCPDQAKISLTSHYPTVDYVCCPVYNRTAEKVINKWMINKGWDGTNNFYQLKLKKGERYDCIAQPYLCAMIRRIINALGYTIGTNQIDSSIYSRLHIVHGEETDEYSKMLPGWTVQEFFEQIEDLLNVVFVVNNKTKAVNVIFSNKYYAGAKEVHLSEVEDDYETEVDDDNTTEVTNANLTYDLPDNDYYKFRRISSVASNRAEFVYFNSFSEVTNYFLTTSDVSRKIVIDVSTGRWYCTRPTGDVSAKIFIEIDEFRNLDRSAESDIKFGAVPVEMIQYIFDQCDSNGKVTDKDFIPSYYTWQIPCIDVTEAVVDEEDSTANIADLISTGTSTTEESKGKLFLSFYHGLFTEFMNNFKTSLFPVSCPDNVLQCDTSISIDADASLRFSTLDTYLYSGIYDIDTTKEFSFYCSDNNLPDAHGIFVIHNKRFACKDMTFTISNAAKVKRWKITAYPISISDTEALNRWILEDGNWRDGGVWLDNGRWLDN